MLHKDKKQLALWMRTNASLLEVENTSTHGILENERFTNDAVRAYRLLWLWSAFRHDASHDIAYRKLGKDLYYKRIDRCRKIIDRILKQGL